MTVPRVLSRWWLPAALALIQLAALPGDYLGMEHDDAHYVLASRSLARGGYGLGVSPGDPPLTFITPGWPLLLVPAAWLSGDSPLGYHLTAWAFLVLCDVLVWLWLRRRTPMTAALCGTVLFGLNPLVLARAGKVMPEVPALALTMALLLALDRPRWPAWASGAALGFGWLVRAPTVALIPAVCGRHLFAGKGRPRVAQAVQVAAVAVLPMLAWWAWTARDGSAPADFGDLHAGYAAGLGSLVVVAAENLSFYTALWGGLWLPFPPRGSSWESLLGGALLLVSALGARRVLRERRWDPALAWLGFGALMHLFWPWRYERYLIPFLPMLLWTLLEGLEALLRRLGGRRVAAACAVILAGQFLGQGRHVLSGRAARGSPELARSYAWICSHTAPHEAVASLFYSRDALYLGRPAMPLPPPALPAALAEELARRRASYVLLEEPSDAGSSLGPRFATLRALERLRESLERPPFKAVYRNPAEGAAVFAVPGPRRP